MEHFELVSEYKIKVQKKSNVCSVSSFSIAIDIFHTSQYDNNIIFPLNISFLSKSTRRFYVRF